MNTRIGAITLAVLATACGGRDRGVSSNAVAPADWRAVVTASDRGRLRHWRDSWMLALGKARDGGQGAALAAQGGLFDPDRALPRPVPPPGDYRCRMFKLGARAAGAKHYVAYPVFACRIDTEGQVASFHKVGGTQRPVGLIFDDAGGRAIFLGTLMLGDETAAVDYGRDRMRDMAGMVDRIGERRWRIVLPAPTFESMLDVIELVPAG